MADEILLSDGFLELSVTPNSVTSVDLNFGKADIAISIQNSFLPNIETRFVNGSFVLGLSKPLIYSYCNYVSNKGYEVWMINEDSSIKLYGYGGYDDTSDPSGLPAFADAVDALNVIDSTRKNILISSGGLNANSIDIRQNPNYP